MPAKKSSRKAPAKKQAPRKAAKRSTTVAATTSTRPFMEARFSEQTVYWIIIGVAVIALAVWVLSLQTQINEMYDQIEVQSSNTYVPLNSRL